MIRTRRRSVSAALGAGTALLIGATRVWAQEGTPVHLHDLIGLDVAGVQARLGSGSSAPPPGISALSAPGGVVQMTDAGAFGGSMEGGLNCSVRTDPLVPSSILVFRSGRMVEAVRPPPPRPLSGPDSRDGAQALNAYMRAPLLNVAVASAGELPLQRGVETFLATLGPPLPDDVGFVRVCSPDPRPASSLRASAPLRTPRA